MQLNRFDKFSVWGLSALGLVFSGALLSQGVVAQEKAIYSSGTDVPHADKVGNPGRAMNQMREAYEAYKAAGWDPNRIPMDLLRNPDSVYDESPHNRASNVLSYIVPRYPVYNEVALFSQTYFRRNVTVFKNKSVVRPSGFWLVMYKNGNLERVKWDEVRAVAHPTMEGATIPVFPGMAIYDTRLPLFTPAVN